ncbi:MAG: nickel-dependent hydrogenase large subunit [Anaerolineae bacterium]
METPRFFGGDAARQTADESSHITSRICGICAIGHAIASLRATEKALGITLTCNAALAQAQFSRRNP